MGLFRTSDSIITQAMPLTAAMIASIDQRPAWLNENQSGTLGTNLSSSVIYCGTMPTDGTGSISVILPGVPSKSVSSFGIKLEEGGTEYTSASNVATTSDTGVGSGLTVNISASPTSFSGPTGGDGNYVTGAIDTFVPALAAASGTVTAVDGSGNPTAVSLTGIDSYPVGQEVELRQSGGGATFTGTTPAFSQSPSTTLNLDNVQETIQVGDTVTGPSIPAGTTVVNASSALSPVLSQSTGPSDVPVLATITFSRTGTPASGSKITITASDNTVVSATLGNNAGLNYNVGDVVTIAQAGSDLNAKITITELVLKPLASQAITFAGLQSGSILPVTVDYVTAVSGSGVTVSNFIVGK